jgi:hypothetical protein
MAYAQAAGPVANRGPRRIAAPAGRPKLARSGPELRTLQKSPPLQAKLTHSPTNTIHLSHDICIKNRRRVYILISHPYLVFLSYTEQRTHSGDRFPAGWRRTDGGEAVLGHTCARAHPWRVTGRSMACRGPLATRTHGTVAGR